MNKLIYKNWHKTASLSPIFLLSVLALSACDNNSSSGKSDNESEKNAIPDVKITILDDRCEPMTLTVQSGKNRFLILNKSSKSVEWEILKGVRIIDERENIPPGFTQKMTVNLDHGEYEMACGLLSNPRGTLIVEAKNNVTTRKPTEIELIGAQAEYGVYVNRELTHLQSIKPDFIQALTENNLAQAQAIYSDFLQTYTHISPILKRTTPDNGIDLALQNIAQTLTHQAVQASANEKTDELNADLITEAQVLFNSLSETSSALSSLKVSALQMVQDAITMANNAQTTSMVSAMGNLDLAQAQGNLESSARIFRLVRNMLLKADPELAEKLIAQFKTLDNFKTLEETNVEAFLANKEAIQTLQTQLKQLSESMKKMPQALGIE